MNTLNLISTYGRDIWPYLLFVLHRAYLSHLLMKFTFSPVLIVYLLVVVVVVFIFESIS